MRHALTRLVSSPTGLIGLVAAVVAVIGSAFAGSYVAADRVVRTPPAETEVLPERFLRGFDPITVTFTSDVARGPGPADDASALAAIKPAWPGAWSFVDARTLQFRPAEPWPALHRFAVEARGKSRVLTTMMTAPESMSPDDGASGLAPFRTLTLTFPQALPEADLKKMIRLEVRDLPGLADARRRPIDRFSLSLLPRKSEREPATWAIGLDDDVPEGSVLTVTVALALGDERSTLWQGRASTRTAFRLEEVACGSSRLGVLGEPHASAEQALDCGSRGEEPQLLFSAPVGGVSLTALKKLVRLEPAVADLTPRVSGRRVTLTGRFVPETLYRMRLGDAPILDEHGRRLEDPGEASVHFFVGKKRPHLRVKRGQVTVEQLGPRMLPLSAVGDTRADVRIHRIDPRHAGLWPFPDDAVVIDEGSDPPFPGEEPAAPPVPGTVSSSELQQHLRLLGSPLVSRLVPLPATSVAGGSFGLDLGPLLDSAPGVGVKKPGTFLVGVRRLEGRPERAWARVQVTNLSLTIVEERQRAVVVVRAVDSAAAVAGATVTVEALEEKTRALKRRSVTTDSEGKATLTPEPTWERIVRVLVEKGDDVLVLDPQSPPPRFFNNHWRGGGGLLTMLTDLVPPRPKNDATLGFLFSERPIYRPGETVYLKGFVREKRDGVLTLPQPQKATPTSAPAPPKLTIKVTRPGGDEVSLTTTTTALFGGDAAFVDKDPVTGWHTARLFLGNQATPIATRRFQVEAYRIPTFEVRLAGPDRAPLDRPFKVTASARYYAGGSVVDQPVRWTVSRRPAWYTPKGREGFLFASSTQFARPDAGERAEQMTKSGTLDESGADAIEVNPEKDLDGSPRIYRFEATVTGADDQEVSAVSEVLALPPFVLGMKLERFKKEATRIEPAIVAVGVDDKTIAGQKVEVRLSRRTWHSHLRESHFATGQASYVTEQEDTLVSTTTVTTTAEPLVVPLPIDKGGVYVVELVSRDKLGRVQTLSADLYIGGKEPMAWQKGQAGVFELVGDKKEWAPGETANVVVKSPFQQAKGLLIVEGPTGNSYRPFDVSGGAAMLSIPIDKSATPNLPIHVVLSRGRLGEASREGGGGDDAPWRPQTVASSLDLAVTPTKNSLAVKVEHPAQARPGDSIDVTVTLKDDRGQAVDGEATLWLVDEAVLALATEQTLDPLSALITRNQRDTTVSDTRNSLLGRLLEEESPGGDGGEDGEATGKAARRVRKNFQTVPFYQATVVVKGGRTVVKVPLSDDLTNFKVRAVAVAGAERFGRHESTLKVRLPVIVQPQLPRFVRQGDRFEGGGVARLVEGEGGAGVVKAEYKGPVVERKRSADVSLVKDKAVSVTFPVEVGAQASDAPLVVKMEVLKKKDGQGDAFEVSIPVLPDVQWQTHAGLTAIGTTPVTLPGPREAPRPGTARQTVVATHVPGLLEVVGAVDSLVAYPHGCLEQKMARLSPYLSLLRLKARVDGVFPSGSASRGHVERLLAEMPAHQDERGLFGYWPGSTGDVQLTARALEWMAMAKESGATVDDAVRTRAEQAVLASLRSDAVWDSAMLPWRAPLMAQALRALSRANAVDDAYLADLLQARKTLDAVGRADLALAALSRGETFKKDAAAMTSELWSSVTFQMVEGRRAVVGLNDPRAVWGGRVLGSSTSALATVLEALVRLDPTNKDLPLLLDAVLQRGRGPVPGFGSTWDNRAAVAAILAYVDLANPAGSTSTLTVGGEKLALDGNKKLVRLEREGPTALQASAQGAPVQARTTWRYLPAASGDRLAAAKAGFLVQRSMTIYPAGGGTPRRVDDVRAAEQRFAVGDVVELHVTVTSDQPRHHVAVVIPFAAGFEPLNPELKTAGADAVTVEKDTITPTAWARLDHEQRAYFTSLPKGTFSLHFRVRATTPGSYTHPGAFAELMYDAAVAGRSDGSRVIVERGAADIGGADE